MTLTNISFAQNIYFGLDSIFELKYNAIFKDTLGNITDEEIIFKSLGTPWEYQNDQIKVEYLYFPTDSIINLLNNPLSKKGRFKDIRILTKSTSGYINSEKSFWIHPFRANQYVFTEIAPFPSVYFENLKIGGKWEEKLFIPFGWGIFNGRVQKKYEVIDIESFEFKGEIINECWVIEAVGLHSKLGVSTIKYCFHPNFGFLYMKYYIYNGVEIEFKLIDIIKPNNQ
jgi:hypothetical protein